MTLKTICENHPKAGILHTWDEDYARKGCKAVIRNEKYECEICGKELLKPLPGTMKNREAK